MASSERGIKRQCLHCGTKFYDLNRDPVLCPNCGKVFLLSEARTPRYRADEDEETDEVEVDEVVDPNAPEVVSLDEAETEDAAEDEIPDVEDVEDVEDIGDDDADVFLEEDEDEDENLAFDVGGGNDER